jgi:alcohol dehydrogenase, propanol-preferring
MYPFAQASAVPTMPARRNNMHAMVLAAPGAPLAMLQREDPVPGDGQIRVKISACGVCRTDLHVVDTELPGVKK